MSDRARLLELAARVEAASGPDDALDEAIMAAIFRRENRFIGAEEEQDDGTWMRVPDAVWVDPTTNKWVSTNARRFTASLDAAESLVPARHSWSNGTCNESDLPWACVTQNFEPFADFASEAENPRLALTCAALRALAQEALAMTDKEIVDDVVRIRRLYGKGRSLCTKIADGMADRMEAAGVTEADLERLGLVEAPSDDR